jgi:hypothetical protein
MRRALEAFHRRSTDQLKSSLVPGNPGSLKVRIDGTVGFELATGPPVGEFPIRNPILKVWFVLRRRDGRPSAPVGKPTTGIGAFIRGCSSDCIAHCGKLSVGAVGRHLGGGLQNGFSLWYCGLLRRQIWRGTRNGVRKRDIPRYEDVAWSIGEPVFRRCLQTGYVSDVTKKTNIPENYHRDFDRTENERGPTRQENWIASDLSRASWVRLLVSANRASRQQNPTGTSIALRVSICGMNYLQKAIHTLRLRGPLADDPRARVLQGLAVCLWCIGSQGSSRSGRCY